ncbi:hypothetical protein GJ496_002818 [Pomphorhynchus laevis]|nr:hypothetical protein GJ496_002818 [Pomphorhynchus laevis]
MLTNNPTQNPLPAAGQYGFSVNVKGISVTDVIGSNGNKPSSVALPLNRFVTSKTNDKIPSDIITHPAVAPIAERDHLGTTLVL